MRLCGPEELNRYVDPQLASHEVVKKINERADFVWHVFRIAVLGEKDEFLQAVKCRVGRNC